MYQPTRRRDLVEVGQDQRIGEENGVVEERLCDHQAQCQERAAALGVEQRRCDLAERRGVPRDKPGARQPVDLQSMPAAVESGVDARHDPLRLLGAAVRSSASAVISAATCA